MHKRDMLLSIDRFCTFLAVDTYLQAGESNNGDVVYEDDDVCVLKPDSKRGIIIYHEFRESAKESIDSEGLILHAGKSTGVRTVDHPYIFFRAPGAGCIECGLNPTVDDININYASGRKMGSNDLQLYFCIRVDPSKTYVYSSECRAIFSVTDRWEASRSTLKHYLNVIKKNTAIVSNKYNVLTYEKADANCTGEEFTNYPPELNAEILVRSSIPPEWRVTIRRS